MPPSLLEPGLLFISWADFGWIALGLFMMFNALAVVVLSLTWLERKALGRSSIETAVATMWTSSASSAAAMTTKPGRQDR